MITKYEYNPDEKYYMVSFFDSTTVAWIRNPFLTAKEVGKWLDAFSSNKERYKEINIIKEDSLDIPGVFETAHGDHKEFTIREVLYDRSYEEYARIIRGTEDTGLSEKPSYTYFRVASNSTTPE